MKKKLSFLLLIISLKVSAQTPITSTEIALFGDHIFIHLSVDGSEPLDFIFDTGDGLPVIDLDIAQELKLDLNHRASKTSAQGHITGALIDHNTIELNGIELESDIQLYATSLRHLEMSIGRNVDGIVGYDLLEHYVVKLNYDNETFELYDPSTYVHEGGWESFEFKLDNYIPHMCGVVTLNNGEQIDGDFFINTGAGTSLDFNTSFAKKNEILGKTGAHFSYPVTGLSKKETTHYEGRVEGYGFGTFNFSKMPVGISTAKKGIQANKKVAGIMGNRLLKRFNITFDYSRGKVYFQKNSKFDEEFYINASGLYLQFDDRMEKLLVHRIYDASPARMVDIKIFAQVRGIEGRSVSEYTLPEIRELLSQANKEVELTLLQDGEEKIVKLSLRKMI